VIIRGGCCSIEFWHIMTMEQMKLATWRSLFTFWVTRTLWRHVRHVHGNQLLEWCWWSCTVMYSVIRWERFKPNESDPNNVQ
jgi:hypothetical protein